MANSLCACKAISIATVMRLRVRKSMPSRVHKVSNIAAKPRSPSSAPNGARLSGAKSCTRSGGSILPAISSAFCLVVAIFSSVFGSGALTFRAVALIRRRPPHRCRTAPTARDSSIMIDGIDAPDTVLPPRGVIGAPGQHRRAIRAKADKIDLQESAVGADRKPLQLLDLRGGPSFFFQISPDLRVKGEAGFAVIYEEEPLSAQHRPGEFE